MSDTNWSLLYYYRVVGTPSPTPANILHNNDDFCECMNIKALSRKNNDLEEIWYPCSPVYNCMSTMDSHEWGETWKLFFEKFSNKVSSYEYHGIRCDRGPAPSVYGTPFENSKYVYLSNDAAP
jgi:hypothetical protein